MDSTRIAYVDIDAHHGDGVFYAFESDPALIFADMHEDGRYLYPGTGARRDRPRRGGRAPSSNSAAPGRRRRRLPRRLGAGRGALARLRPEFIILQCGADSLAGDPITHLRYSPAAHGRPPAICARWPTAGARPAAGAWAAAATTGGNLAAAWNAVVEAFVAGRPA